MRYYNCDINFYHIKFLSFEKLVTLLATYRESRAGSERRNHTGWCLVTGPVIVGYTTDLQGFVKSGQYDFGALEKDHFGARVSALGPRPERAPSRQRKFIQKISFYVQLYTKVNSQFFPSFRQSKNITFEINIIGDANTVTI